MKKFIPALTIVLSVILGFGLIYVSQAQNGNRNGQGKGMHSNYVDANGDGVCDNQENGSKHTFIDNDGDGICDNHNDNSGNYGNRGKGMRGQGQGTNCGNCTNFVDEDGDGVCDNKGTGANFVDADGDGVCDNAGTGTGCCGGKGKGKGMRGQGHGANFVDADGDGVCDNHANGTGANFVDADGDGVCDNHGQKHRGGKGGCGKGMRGQGHGANFVDADGDGVCDNHANGTGPNFVDADGDGVCDNAGTGKGCCGGKGGHGANFVDENGNGICDRHENLNDEDEDNDGNIIISSVEDNSAQKLAVYPNPTEKEITLEFTAQSGVAQISITDINGNSMMSKEVMLQNGANKVNLDLSKLLQGNYLIKIKSGNEVMSSSIQVMR